MIILYRILHPNIINDIYGYGLDMIVDHIMLAGFVSGWLYPEKEPQAISTSRGMAKVMRLIHTAKGGCCIFSLVIWSPKPKMWHLPSGNFT